MKILHSVSHSLNPNEATMNRCATLLHKSYDTYLNGTLLIRKHSQGNSVIAARKYVTY